jgi:hypothetical protein
MPLTMLSDHTLTELVQMMIVSRLPPERVIAAWAFANSTGACGIVVELDAGEAQARRAAERVERACSGSLTCTIMPDPPDTDVLGTPVIVEPAPETGDWERLLRSTLAELLLQDDPPSPLKGAFLPAPPTMRWLRDTA